ncbi:MAG: methionyl-tRNA formyltransferase [Patescibacteria group bacterium]
MQKEKSKIPFVFFGTSAFSVGVLNALKEKGFVPLAVVTREDKPQGRGLELTPSETKIWATIHGLPVLQPARLDSEFAFQLSTFNFQLFVVASYGKIIPKEIFGLPPRKTLNVHPSLLPKLRGASPIQNTILQSEEIGITIMEISEKMDEGPIVAQEKVEIKDASPNNPPRADILEELLARSGGELLARILPDWVEGKIKSVAQDESQATYCKKIEKLDAEINLFGDPLENLRKIRAYFGWPDAFTIFKNKYGKEVRVIIKDAEIKDGVFSPTRVVPAGKREMDWDEFLRGNA